MRKQTRDWHLTEAPKVGEWIVGEGSVVPGNCGVYVYEVLSAKAMPRFNKPNFLMKVNVYAHYPLREATNFVETTTRWANQLF